MIIRNFISALAVTLSLFVGGFYALPVHAQVDTGLNAVGNTVVLSDTDPRTIAAGIINVVLGLLGIIFLVLILYAGFLWMTSGGDSAKIDKAKAYLRNSIIGLVIIMTSWAIATFVINSLLNATGGNGGGSGGSGGGGSGGGGFGGGTTDVFRVSASSPQGAVPNADLIVRILFNKDVNANSLNELQIEPSVNGNWEIDPSNPKRVLFTPSDPCPINPQKTCFAFNTSYTVTIGSNFQSAANEEIRCGGFYPDCSFNFTAGDSVDMNAPSVSILNLYDGKSVPIDSAVEVKAYSSDDAGISGMEWSEGGVAFASEGPTASPSPKEFEASGYWDTLGLVAKQTYTVTVTADDLDSNTGEDSVDLIVLNQHCFDDTQNEDETGIDCGGNDCLSCSGGTCTSNNQCASGLCVNGTCIEQPIILDVQPLSGKEGTYVSIWGDNFGDTGTVSFLGPPEVTAQAPQACLAAGATTWSPHYVLVEVPAGASSGALKLTNSNSALSDQTDDSNGPVFTFQLTNEEFPGICQIDPTAGQPGINATLKGAGFGDQKGSVEFGNTEISQNTSWSDSEITFPIPIASPGTYPVWAKNISGAESNKVPFKLQSSTQNQPAPEINLVDPASGPKGAYITITGQRFGTSPGVVYFYDKIDPENGYVGDTSFPNGCEVGWWKDNQIIVKVPDVPDSYIVKPAAYEINIKRADQEISNRVDFTYTDGVAGPGICAMQPSAGPAGTTITKLIGEGFGGSGQNSQVIFYDNEIAVTNSWLNNEIQATVPQNARTGAVYIDIAGQKSNKVQFAVASCLTDSNICSSNEVCCADGTCTTGVCAQQSFTARYSWQFSTGVIPQAPEVIEYCDTSGQNLQLPSPTPWINQQGGDSVCVNPRPTLGIMFNMPIAWSTQQNPLNLKELFKLKKCTGSGADPCEASSLEDVAITNINNSHISTPQGNAMDYVSFNPEQDLDPDTYYYVFVSSNVHSADMEYGDYMEEKISCPDSGLGYCYQFKTKPQSDICQVGGVYIAPDKATVQGSELQEFIAMPVQEGGICNLLDGSSFSWDWTTDPASKAWLEDPNNANNYKQDIRSGMQEAVNPPVMINAEEQISSKAGDAELYIRFIEPKIMAKFPDCDTACANIELWAQFNTSLWSDNPTPPFANSVLAKDAQGRYKNVKLFKCANENCLLENQVEVPIDVYLDQFSDVTGYEDVKYSRVRILPVISLEQSTYYRVWVSGGSADSIASKYGVRMAQPYEWKFRTKLDNAVCEPDRVSVMPKRVIENKIGDSELFTSAVYGPPDQCSPGGQLLKTNKSFIWTFPQSPQNIAGWVFSPPSQIDADGDLSPGCSADCKPLGSDGKFKAVAQCGNGIVETTDGGYCDPNTNTTKAGQPCVMMPTNSGAGEQCDKQGGSWGACDPASCLWKPVPGGTCGNGIIEYANGEMCDPGIRCFDVDDSYQALEGSPCNSQTAIDQCAGAGGVCEIREFYGCTTGCRNLGASAVVGTTCGEGTIGLGEDCDLGNFNGVGGCSLNCLHTGSSPNVQSVCGNAELEPGETCEAPNINDGVPSWCDSEKCINKGTLACQNPTDPSCCGNNTVDDGEDCDDGYPANGDGCSASCLYEGSSWSYASPSFCGNGKLESGEACEVNAATDRVIKENIPNTGTITGTGDGKLDPKQLAQIIGIGVLDSNNISETQIQSGYEGVVGIANYGVQCGYTSEAECDSSTGLDANGCCAQRPELLPNSKYPTGDGICRNTVIKAEFKTPMDAQSVIGNFIIAKEMTSGTSCPDGSEELASNIEPPQTVWQWIVYGWHKVVSWFKGEPAQALWCTRQVSGSLSSVGTSTTQYIYRLDTALDPNTRYIVRFAADPDLDDNTRTENKSGIRTARGVVTTADSGNDPANPANNWRFTWSFTTGADICRINSIVVEDLNEESPGFYKKSQEIHLFQALARALYNGKAQEISQTNEYGWEWQPWIVNDPEIAKTDDNPDKNSPESLSLIRSLSKNGSAMVFASLKITVDTLDPNSTTQGAYVEGAMPITVFICDYPWPPVGANGTYSVFKDHEDSPLLSSGPYFNFQTMYCRDHENGVLPILTPHLIDKSPSDDELGILRQYLFTYEDPPAFKGDGIGIRLFQNPYHYSPLEWYHVQGFIGNPEQIKVDGYDAVRDGGTVYISFPNTQGLDQNIYQNILVISHNINASAVTKDIFDQLLENIVFNINFDFDNTNVCVLGGQTGLVGGEAYTDPATQQSVLCVSDWDCLTKNPDLRCASFKYKLRHDMQRLVDFKTITAAAEQYKNEHGKYPTVAQGTFLPSQTNSLWPSWNETLAADLGITMPIDPVNRFVSCGFCKHSTEDVQTDLPCLTDTDCPEAYYCEARDGYDPLTCWNTAAREFKCPYIDDDPNQQFDTYSAEEPHAPSRFYKYRSFDGGKRFELAANFEVAPMSFDPITKDTENWWTPAYPTELRQCVTDSPLSNGRFCNTINDCKPCINPSSPTCTADAPANSCKPVGYRWSFKNICNNDIFGETAICGDGIKGLVCSGSKDGCKVNGDCPSGETCSDVEFCELGETKLVDCDYQGVSDGFKLQVCQDCKQWVDDPNLSLCRQKVECGNGRVDGLCSGSGKSCSLNTDCPSGESCELKETCDDGALNGTYGHCNANCTSIDKYCGDGKLNPGEDCDRGSSQEFGNGAWCSDLQECYQGTGKEVPYGETCNLGCTGHAPYCGDGKISGPESCDGNILTTTKAICRNGTNKNLPCDTSADCGSGLARCGLDKLPIWQFTHYQSYRACDEITIKRCATGAKICLAPDQYKVSDGLMEVTNLFPTPNNYQSCTTDAGCDAGKSCISLNQLKYCNNDAQCSAGNSVGVCREYQTEHVRNCQDPNPQNANQCQFEDTWSDCKLAQYCGNGIKEVDEECDLGSGNGYDKSCLPTCKVNVCGDGYLNLNVEECDNGADNGKSVCSAQYGATCNNCSVQCKIQAVAGGYCGNQKKETGEQCDGNITVSLPPPDPSNHIATVDILASAIANDPLVSKAQTYIGGLCEHPPCQVQCGGGECLTMADATTVTCKQLGYDYAINDVFNRSIIIKNQAKAAAYQIPGESSKHVLGPIKLISDSTKNNLLNRIYYNCGLMDAETVNTNCPQGFTCAPYTVRLFWKPQTDWPDTQEFWQCVEKEGLLNGFGMDGEPNDKPVCTQGCLPGGCGRCSEEPGTGEIHGYVLDRLWLQAVPGARVSLVYRGIVVDQTDTGLDGEYSFSGLNTRSECDKYKIIIDKYDDNICTDLKSNRPANGCLRDMTGDFNRIVDEGKNGGYWSYETDEFSVESFPWQEALGLIYIYPKPAKGEGYVSYGRPTLVDEQGWSDLQNCLKTKTPGECREYLSLWLPWKKEWTPHVIWPSNQARYVPWLESANGTNINAGYETLCSYKDRGTDTNATADNACMRDYNWFNNGNYQNLGQAPYTGIICPSMKWDWNNDANNNCPMAGADVCYDNCTSASGGAWRLLNEWTDFEPTDVQCQQFCKISSCPSKDQILTGWNWNLSDDPLMAVDRCNTTLNSAQTTAFFRYADPVNLNESLPDLNANIEIYFSGPDYEPIAGENVYTAVVPNSAEFTSWLNNQNLPPAYVNMMKTLQCGTADGSNQPCESNVDAYINDLVAKQKFAPISWREYWAKTHTKVYVATDKGLKVIENNSQTQTRSDFQKPFWHIASISPNGAVIASNNWEKVADVVPLANNHPDLHLQPETAQYYGLMQTAQRVPGLACWNTFGANCRLDFIPAHQGGANEGYQYIPDKWSYAQHACSVQGSVPGGQGLGVLNYFTPLPAPANNDAICKYVWNAYGNLSGITIPAVYINDIEGDPDYLDQYFKLYGQTNW